jgi:hypothetical protein
MSLHAKSERQGALRIIESRYLYHDRGQAAIRVDLQAERRLRKMENPGIRDRTRSDKIPTKERDFAALPWRSQGLPGSGPVRLGFFGTGDYDAEATMV